MRLRRKFAKALYKLAFTSEIIALGLACQPKRKLLMSRMWSVILGLFITGPYASGSNQGEIVRLTVHVPAGAEIWVEGEKTKQTGSSRLFYSPPIVPGKNYVYEIRAMWTAADGKVVDRARKVKVR